MKFLYILVSNDLDIYYEQTLVSVVSLRYHNPEAFISLLVDDGTDKNLTGFRSGLKEQVQEYKVVPFSADVSNKERSRLLKTDMRNLIDGDFLYIDGDTAIVSSLDDFPLPSAPVAAIADLHARENDKYHLKHKKNNRDKRTLGFSLSLGDIFFNGGVIYAKDCPEARTFFGEWNRLYRYCAEHSIYTDQISFNESNRVLGFPIQELPGEWNCQVREAYNHLYRVKTIYPMLCRAKIIHFFGSGIDGKKEPHPLMRKDFFERIKREQGIGPEAMTVIDNAKTAFFGAPDSLDSQKRFPLFFIYRQFPRLYRALLALDKLRHR